MKKIILSGILAIIIYACNSGSDDSSKATEEITPDSGGEKIPNPGGSDVAKYDPNRGVGKFTTVDIKDKLDVAMATGGEKIYGVKCSGCHKLTDEKLVGPGWKGVTNRH